MAKALPIAAALVIVILAGIAHGLWTDRWNESGELSRATERVQQIPLNLGDWRGEELVLDERQIFQGDIKAYRSRRYVHQTARDSELQFLLLCGDPRYISLHTPDVCYGGVGNELISNSEKHTVLLPNGEPAEFQVTLFRHQEAGVTSYLRILWAFSTDGRWVAPDEPRRAFPSYHHRVLYKIYVVRQFIKGDEPLDQDPCNDFIRTLLPELQKTLFPPSPQA